MKKYVYLFLLSLILLDIPLSLTAEENNNLNNYLSYFYNRYSQHFDLNGLIYAIPEYGIPNFTEPSQIREWVSLVSYYQYRAQNGEEKNLRLMRWGILKGYEELLQRGSQSQSFQEAEAHFLTIRIMEKFPNLFPEKTKMSILKIILNYLTPGINAPDTENRAIIAGAHWQYLVDYFYSQNQISFEQKKHLDSLIKNKIDSAIQESINTDGWYLENNFTDFSIHYHAVSAFMLMFYGDLTQQKEYLDLSQKMQNNLKKITLPNGEIPAELGHRPAGLGAQFYLMQGLLSYYFDDPDYMLYLSLTTGNKFFSDPNYPNRLEFHSETEFNDDYAFSDIAELGLMISKLKNIYLYYHVASLQNKPSTTNNTFQIQNTGQKITLNKKPI